MLAGDAYRDRIRDELAAHFGVRHVFLVSSGKAALALVLGALRTLGGDRNEVLIPAYTCFSVPSAVVKMGLKLAACDIDARTFDFDPAQLERSIGPRTLCVVAGHLFGMPSDMARVRACCAQTGCFVVEDAAQAMGAVRNGRYLGTLGDVGFFSLGRGKNLSCGGGGVIVTNSDAIAERISREYERLAEPGLFEMVANYVKIVLLELFVRPSLYWFPAGLRFLRLGETFFYRDFPIKKLSGMQAGVLTGWRARLENSNEARKRHARGLIDALKLDRPRDTAYLRLPVLAQSPEMGERLLARSREKGLGLSAMYPTEVSEIPEIKDQFAGMDFPAARDVASRLLVLPTHPLLTTVDLERIADLAARYALATTPTKMKAPPPPPLVPAIARASSERD
jgi:dTDP-4-amino-4,6-dideoxygalactose transaminase